MPYIAVSNTSFHSVDVPCLSIIQEELSAGLWLSGECLPLHSVLVCLDENEKLLRSVGLEEELTKFSSFSFEVFPTHTHCV